MNLQRGAVNHRLSRHLHSRACTASKRDRQASSYLLCVQKKQYEERVLHVSSCSSQCLVNVSDKNVHIATKGTKAGLEEAFVCLAADSTESAVSS